MAKTETIESLLSPSLRVSRPVAACARCRSAKIKCDGKLPACSACERSGKANSCSSANDEFARGKERSYVAALEAAAQRLQKKIDAVRVESDANQAIQSSTGRPIKPIRKVSAGRRKEASDVDELVSDFGFLTVNATSRDFNGFTSTMSFAKLLLSISKRSDLPSFDNVQLPKRYALTEPLNYYLDSIFVLLPFFSETDLMASISRVYQESSSIPVTPLDFWYVRLILAISSASRSQVKNDEFDNDAIRHITAAMQLADYVLHPGSITGVQALLLLVQYSLVDPEHFDSWYLISMASRLVIDLGLHCEPSAETKISKDALDIRRRIFHCTYALDRAISMSMDRPFSFTDDSCSEVELPVVLPEQEPQSPSQIFLRSLKSSLFLYDIRRVQSAFYQATRWSSRSQWTLATASSYATSVSSDIQGWFSTIPTTLSQQHLVFFNLERLYSQILVVAPNLKLPIVNMTELNKALVFEYAVQYAEQMHPITQNVQWHTFLTYSDIYRTLFVGRQFLEIMWSDFDRMLKAQHLIAGIASNASSTPQENCARAIQCINKIIDILNFAHQRWNIPDLRKKFKQESAVLSARLQNRQQEFSASSFSNIQASPPVFTVDQQWNPNNMIGASQYTGTSGNNFQNPLPNNTSSSQSINLEGLQSQSLTPPGTNSQMGNYGLPQGSLPRRSYEFLGRSI